MGAAMIAAGLLRDRITVQRKRTADDGYGNHTADWRNQWSAIPARVAPMKGGEQVRAARLSEVSPYEITIRSNPTTRLILPTDRLVNDRSKVVYEIKHVMELDNDLVLTCEAVR